MTTTAYSAFKDGPGDVPTNLATIGSLKLPAGKYAIFAKLFVTQASGDGTKVSANQLTARLEAGGDFDTSVTLIGIAMNHPEFASNAESIALMVVHEFGAEGGNAVVKLDKKPNNTPHLSWSFLKITAIRVDALSNVPMP